MARFGRGGGQRPHVGCDSEVNGQQTGTGRCDDTPSVTGPRGALWDGGEGRLPGADSAVPKHPLPKLWQPCLLDVLVKFTGVKTVSTQCRVSD